MIFTLRTIFLIKTIYIKLQHIRHKEVLIGLSAKNWAQFLGHLSHSCDLLQLVFVGRLASFFLTPPPLSFHNFLNECFSEIKRKGFRLGFRHHNEAYIVKCKQKTL